MAFVKLVVFGFIALTVIYWSVTLYSRSVRRERLENQFDSAHPQNTDKAARDAFVQDGMTAYEKSIRPRLIGLVYVVPAVVVLAAIYVTNAN